MSINSDEALHEIARALSRLGNADASTHLGAIENLSMVVEKGCESIASSNNAIAASLELIADAINRFPAKGD